jgi:hypothetical protein
VNDHSIAIETSTQELVSCSPQIEPKSAIIELTETLDHELSIPVEVARPLLKCEEIAMPVIEQLLDAHGRLRELVQEIMKYKEGMITAVNVFHHVRG